MKYFLRYSKNIALDIENWVSYHYTGMDKSFSVEEIENGAGLSIDDLEWNEEADMYVQPLAGLCVFELEADNLEDAIEEAKTFSFNSVYNSKSMGDIAHLLTGEWVEDCPEGVLIENAKLAFSI